MKTDGMQKFVVDNFKVIVSCVAFVFAFYVQYQMNMMRVAHLESQIITLNAQLETQYQKLDAIKLDKSVFEATTKQWASMSQDIREIRNAVMGNHKDSK